MHDTSKYTAHLTQFPLILAIITLGLLNSGCFVLTNRWRNKPDAPREQVKLNRDADDLRYSRLLRTPDFDLDVRAKDGPTRWKAPFWFYILPIPVTYEYLATQPLSVVVHLEPKAPQITFDPWQIFFAGTNHVRVPPAKIWQDDRWLGTNTFTSKAFPVTNSTKFLLEFSPWNQAYPDYPDRGLPFQLSIESIRVSGEVVSVPSITFKPTTFIRPGFKLPY